MVTASPVNAEAMTHGQPLHLIVCRIPFRFNTVTGLSRFVGPWPVVLVTSVAVTSCCWLRGWLQHFECG